MLSSSNLKSAQADSYFEKDDYYSAEEGPGESRWLGAGANNLGLSGGVEKEQFSLLLNGRSPTGENLFSRKVDPNKRRAATDFTFSAPKSVSVAGLVQGDKRVIAAHHLAVERTLAILEQRYAETRVMTARGRKKVGTGNITAAVFAHGTSRAAEPQLHSHCVVMNATQIENGKWYSFSNDSAIANQKQLGQIYQNELAVELKKLGYEIEQRAHGQFDIKGYSPELLETFSTRRGQIEKLVEQWKASGKVVRDSEGRPLSSERLIYEVATLQTRRVKPQIIEAEKLLKNWKAVLAMKGLTLPPLPSEKVEHPEQAEQAEPLQTEAAVQLKLDITGQSNSTDSESAPSPKPQSILDDAISHCAERDAIFEPKHIERFIFEHHIGQSSIANLQSDISAHPDLIKLGNNRKNRPVVTTETALQLELGTLRLMQAGQGQVQPILSEERVQKSFVDTSLSQEQQSAISTSCAAVDSVIAWQGSAGSGKTFGLNAFKQLAEQDGYIVSGYAPSASAAHELGASLGIETETVARLLITEPFKEPTDDPTKVAAKQLWLVDEAGLLSMKAAHDLLARAQAEKARVVLVGDTKQLSAVEAGNPFKSLQAGGMQTVYLDDVRRQKQAELRQAVQLVAAGEVGKSISLLESAGCIREIKQDSDRLAQVAQDFLALSAEERAETLVLAGTNRNRLALTQEIRQRLQDSGELSDDAFTLHSLQRKDLTTVQARYAGRYRKGDVIVPVRDYKGQQLVRNQPYVVRAINEANNRLTLKTSDNRFIQIDPSDCPRKSVYTAVAEPVAVGDRLKWTKNNRVEETRNGQAFTVTALSSDGTAQTVDDDGNTRTINLAGYQHIDYAWIATTYSAQGKTAARVMALMEAGTVNKEAFYVASSRAKQELQLYTADLGSLRKQADESNANENVSDYLSLFDLAYEHAPVRYATSPADYAREVAANAGQRTHDWQRAATRSHQPEHAAPGRTGAGTPRYVAEFSGVPQRAEKHARWVKRQGQIVRVGEAVGDVDASAQGLQQRAAANGQIADAATRLNQQIERAAGGAGVGSRWPRKQSGKRGHLEEQPPATSAQPTLPPPTQQREDALFELSAAAPAIATDAAQALRPQQQAAVQDAAPLPGEHESASDYVAAFDGIPAAVLQQREQSQRQQQWGQVIAAVGAEIASITHAASGQQRHKDTTQVKAAAGQLQQHIETSMRHVGSRWPRLKSKRGVEKPRLKDKLAPVPELTPELTPGPAPAPTHELLELKPPAAEATLAQQLDMFAKTLGYKTGDPIYVRALLPKNLSDELALKQNLKFKLTQNGKSRLIPNTRRGYLTVGDWSFTHLRRDKEPVVYANGLETLTELNQQGRGIYFVVNPGGEKDGDITQARSLFWENDDKTKPEQLQQARTSGLPVGAIIETNKSLHCYVPFAEPMQDMDEWMKLQERTIQRMESDEAIRNPSRLMRLPGFDHVRVEDDALVFTPVTLRHVDAAAAVTAPERTAQLPDWDAERWARQTKAAAKRTGAQGTAGAVSLAADNPWDIRNFSRYLNGDQLSQNGWLQVQCPAHGGEGHSGNSLHINESTGQYKCHGGCDSKAVYKAAWEMASSRGWQPPQSEEKPEQQPEEQVTEKPQKISKQTLETLPAQSTADKPKPTLGQRKKQTRWQRYEAKATAPAGQKRDYQIAAQAYADRLSKKQVIELLAKHSPRARQLYQEKGSTPAYYYVERIAKAAQQRRKGKGLER